MGFPDLSIKVPYCGDFERDPSLENYLIGSFFVCLFFFQMPLLLKILVCLGFRFCGSFKAFQGAKMAEVRNFIVAGAFEAPPPHLRPSRDQAMGMHWVLTLKPKTTDQRNLSGSKTQPRARSWPSV